MQSSIQYGFIAILLSLCLYFAFVSLLPTETVFRLANGATSYCVWIPHKPCQRHSIIIDRQSNLFLENNIISKAELLEHLSTHIGDCSLEVIYLTADETLTNQQVFQLSSAIRTVSPDSKIVWDTQ